MRGGYRANDQNTEMRILSSVILAIDLGRFKPVARNLYEPETTPRRFTYYSIGRQVVKGKK